MSDDAPTDALKEESKLTVINFTAEETFLLSRILGFLGQPLTTTNRRMIRPMFKLINQHVIPFQKELQEISDKAMKFYNVKIDGRESQEPDPRAQNKVNRDFTEYLQGEKDYFKLEFDFSKDLDPLSVAIRYFVTQIWVNIKVPSTMSEGILFDAVDEKFCEAIPILGRLFKSDKKIPDGK